jgi:diguanylate cyclase (GGDEF)-like protein
MHLDLPTLMVAGSFATALSGLLLIGSWFTTLKKEPALAWWAAANFLYAGGIALILLGTTAYQAFLVAGMLLATLSPALIWAGVRQFEGRRQIWPALFAGIALWFVVGIVTHDGSGPSAAATFVGFVNSTVYSLAAIFELWRGRAEPLRARWPLAALLTIHALVYVGGLSDIVTGSFAEDGVPAFGSWFGLIHFEGIIYAICTALFMLMLCKERGELGYIRAARHDLLTGIASRGALLEDGERLLRRCQQAGRSFSLIMFDLDRFKWINDTYGHAAGDEVIRAFTRATQSILRPADLFGRYGGEEFVIVLPGATIEAAYVIADRIRHAIAATSIMIGNAPVNVTVSGGVANASSDTLTLEAIMKVADACLYRAKELGRNRVERTPRPLGDAGISNVIRVA